MRLNNEIKLQRWVEYLLKGFSQVMLQSNALTGLCFVVGIASNSIIMLLGGIIGGAVSTATAYYTRAKAADIAQGLYGFNGVLVGIAMCFFYRLSFDLNGLVVVTLVVLGAILSTLLVRYVFTNFLLPAYTAPFVISTWLLIYGANQLSLPIGDHSSPVHLLNEFGAIVRGVGQVMFQVGLACGLLFVIGLFISSIKAGFFALISSAIGLVLALIFVLPEQTSLQGVYGYNAVLVAIALRLYMAKKWFFNLLGVCCSVWLTWLCIDNNVIALTAPFVVSSWIIILCDKYLSSRLKPKSDIG